MNQTATAPAARLPRHLISPATLASAAGTGIDVSLLRGHRQGNGVRVHGIYFAAVSLAALSLVIAFISLTSALR